MFGRPEEAVQEHDRLVTAPQQEQPVASDQRVPIRVSCRVTHCPPRVMALCSRRERRRSNRRRQVPPPERVRLSSTISSFSAGLRKPQWAISCQHSLLEGSSWIAIVVPALEVAVRATALARLGDVVLVPFPGDLGQFAGLMIDHIDSWWAYDCERSYYVQPVALACPGYE